MTAHKRGSTVKIECVIRDYDGTLFDPTTHEINVYNGSGTLQSGFPKTDPTQDSTGIYSFYYTIPGAGAPGTWKIKWQCVAATYTSIEEKTFQVIA